MLCCSCSYFTAVSFDAPTHMPVRYVAMNLQKGMNDLLQFCENLRVQIRNRLSDHEWGISKKAFVWLGKSGSFIGVSRPVQSELDSGRGATAKLCQRFR